MVVEQVLVQVLALVLESVLWLSVTMLLVALALV
jgi:hypothetical protein